MAADVELAVPAAAQAPVAADRGRWPWRQPRPWLLAVAAVHSPRPPAMAAHHARWSLAAGRAPCPCPRGLTARAPTAAEVVMAAPVKLTLPASVPAAMMVPARRRRGSETSMREWTVLA